MYYVPRGDDEDALKMLRKELKRTLPKSHIPKDYVALKAIERSPSGKIVKQRLLDPDNLRDPELKRVASGTSSALGRVKTLPSAA